MSDIPIQLFVAAFQDEKGADAALKELKAAKREKLIGIQAAVALRKDEKGKLHSKDAGLTPGKGAAGGVVLGAIVGVLTGGTGLVLGAAGALVGGLMGKKKRHEGFSPGRVEQIADSLQPGTSAIMAVIEHKWVAELEQELEELGAEVLTAAIAADVAEQLAEGRDVAFSAVADEASLTTSRVAAGADQIEVSTTTFTEDAVESMSAVANEAGVAAQHVIETADGVAAESLAATEDTIAYGAGVVTDAGAAIGGVVASLTGGDEEEGEEENEEA